jgi:hypothetical protein
MRVSVGDAHDALAREPGGAERQQHQPCGDAGADAGIADVEAIVVNRLGLRDDRGRDRLGAPCPREASTCCS